MVVKAADIGPVENASCIPARYIGYSGFSVLDEDIIFRNPMEKIDKFSKSVSEIQGTKRRQHLANISQWKGRYISQFW